MEALEAAAAKLNLSPAAAAGLLSKDGPIELIAYFVKK